MDVRSLDPDDTDDLREIARVSMGDAYASLLSERVIDAAVEEWYSDEAIETYVAGDEMAFSIGEIDGTVVGFCQSHVLDDFGKGRILWVHVDPDHQGMGIGTELLTNCIDRLHDRGIDTVTAAVLAEHGAGVAFYEANGFTRLADRQVDIGGEPFREYIMREEGSPDETLELQVDDAGTEFYVDLAESDRGSDGPFCPVYEDPHRNHRYGWFCTACESL